MMMIKKSHDAARYHLNKFLLRFHSDDTEAAYRKSIIDTSMNYIRMAWLSVILFGGFFFLLDERFFMAHAPIVAAARGVLMGFATVMTGLTWWQPARRFMVWCSALFILSVGAFCILQTALSPSHLFSPYILGVFLSFCGIFCTVGMGFSHSLIALCVTLITFEFSLGFARPAMPFIFVIYNFFYVCFLAAFLFLGYYTECVSRKRYIIAAQLADSLDNIQALRRLLPICASCKQIRDDKGYWNQIEIYLAQNSDIEFTHGICPECIQKLYPEYLSELDMATVNER